MFTSSTKVILITLNVIVFVSGGALLAVGLLLWFESGFLGDDVVNLLNQIEYNNLPIGTALLIVAYTSIGIGGVIMIQAMFGLCGAWREKRGCLYCYLGSVIFMVLMLAALAGVWIAIRGRNGEWLRGSLLAKFDIYAGPEATDEYTKGWNELFMEAQCCGISKQYKDGGTNNDFGSTVWWASRGSDNLPASCCQGVDEDSVSSLVGSPCTTTPESFYTDGCYNTISDDINLYSILTIAICAGAALAEVLAFVGACVAVSKKGRRDKVTPINDGETGGSRPPPYVAIEKWKNYRNRRNMLKNDLN